MKPLLFLAFLLACSGVAGAEISLEKNSKKIDYSITLTPKGNRGLLYNGRVYVEATDVDRFLSEQVQKEIEAGDNSMKVNDGSFYDRCWKANGHYLKALVLIEQEKLRRASR